MILNAGNIGLPSAFFNVDVLISPMAKQRAVQTVGGVSDRSVFQGCDESRFHSASGGLNLFSYLFVAFRTHRR
jgi:hypothetical protein